MISTSGHPRKSKEKSKKKGKTNISFNCGWSSVSMGSGDLIKNPIPAPRKQVSLKSYIIRAIHQ